MNNSTTQTATSQPKQKLIDDLKNSVLPQTLKDNHWALYRYETLPNGSVEKALYRPDGTPGMKYSFAGWTDFYQCEIAFFAGNYDGIVYNLGGRFIHDTDPAFSQNSQSSTTTSSATGQTNSTAKSNGKSKSEMLIEAIDDLKLSFKLNQLEDIIEVDEKPLDDLLAADLNLKLTDKGFSRQSIADGITVVASRKAYHPVQDYLLCLKWDGHNHLGEMMKYLTGDGTCITYPDGTQIPLHAVLIGRWMAGTAARALHATYHTPFKHQTPMLVLVGPQGIGKSSWAKWLTSGVGYEYHKEGMVNPHDIEHVRSMVNKWVWEVGELASSLRRTDRDALKNFITQEYHTYRKPYGKHQITKPTLCNFIGTLNPETGFLNDPTGHRRFLPISLTRIDHTYKDSVSINQVWAQVVSQYQSGHIDPELNQAEKAALAAVYKVHEVENPLETYISMYFDVDPGNPIMRTHTAVIIQRLQAFNIVLPSDHKVAGQKISEILAPLGLENRQFRANGINSKGWIGIQPNAATPP